MAFVALLPSVEFEVATVTPVVSVVRKVDPLLAVWPVALEAAVPNAFVEAAIV